MSTVLRAGWKRLGGGKGIRHGRLCPNCPELFVSGLTWYWFSCDSRLRALSSFMNRLRNRSTSSRSTSSQRQVSAKHPGIAWWASSGTHSWILGLCSPVSGYWSPLLVSAHRKALLGLRTPRLRSFPSKYFLYSCSLVEWPNKHVLRPLRTEEWLCGCWSKRFTK